MNVYLYGSDGPALASRLVALVVDREIAAVIKRAGDSLIRPRVAPQARPDEVVLVVCAALKAASAMPKRADPAADMLPWSRGAIRHRGPFLDG